MRVYVLLLDINENMTTGNVISVIITITVIITRTALAQHCALASVGPSMWNDLPQQYAVRS